MRGERYNALIKGLFGRKTVEDDPYQLAHGDCFPRTGIPPFCSARDDYGAVQLRIGSPGLVSSGASPRAEAGVVPAPIDAGHPIRDPIRRAKFAKLFGENPPHDGADNA